MVRYQLCHMNWLWWKSLCAQSSYILSCFRKMSAAFIGMYSFDAWNISCQFMIAFVNDKQSIGNKETSKWEREIYETLVTLRAVFIMRSMLSLHWKRSVMKMWTQLNRAKCKQTCMTTLWESLVFWWDGYCRLKKDIAWENDKSTMA